jgi:steroid 5-alpha reductase family enzyme
VFDLELYAAGLAAALGMAVGAWLVSIPKRDVSIVDSLWSLFFLVMTAVYLLMAPSVGDRAYIVFFLVGVWAVRLSAFITRRNRGEPEDRRYQAIRADHEPGFWWKSLYLVFGLQAILAWIISLPLLAAVLSPAPLGWLDYAAVALWLVGFFFEAVGDQQLADFKRDATSRGKVMDRGLWRYTRHPNYFGEACIWWGYFLFALAGGAWWSILAPLLMTFLLLRVSGVVLLEKDIGERRPGYAQYAARTNAFFPWPPRRADTSARQGD